MTNKVWAFLAIAFIGATFLGAGQANYKIIESQKTEVVASYVVLMSAAQFNRDAVLRLANEFLRENSQVKLLRVGIYTDKPTAIDSKGKNITHFAYAQWLSEFTARKQRRLSPAAELLRTGTDATLRSGYVDGHMEEVAISGQNVFHPTVNGVTLDLLYVTYTRQGFPTKQLTPHFYFSVPNRITLQEASALAGALLRTYRIPGIKIQLRNDEWFVFDSDYPWLNPFAAAQTPPTEPELAQSEEFLCSADREPTCYQTSVRTNK